MVIAPLNRKEIKLHPERVSNIKPFISKYNWDGTKYPSKKKTGKDLNKIIQQLSLMFCMSRK